MIVNCRNDSIMVAWLRHSSAPTCARCRATRPANSPAGRARRQAQHQRESVSAERAGDAGDSRDRAGSAAAISQSDRPSRFASPPRSCSDVTPDMILCGNGSDDILTIATRTFVPPGGTLAFPIRRIRSIRCWRRLQEATIRRRCRGRRIGRCRSKRCWRPKADAIYLANPNAPSGTFVSPMKVAELAKRFHGAAADRRGVCRFCRRQLPGAGARITPTW